MIKDLINKSKDYVTRKEAVVTAWIVTSAADLSGLYFFDLSAEQIAWLTVVVGGVVGLVARSLVYSLETVENSQ